jgi:TolA-binding protein
VGEDFYEAKNFEEAVKAYSVSKQKAGKTELGEKATYKLGWSFHQLKQFDKAVAEFNAHVTEYPKGPLAGDGMFMKAEGLFKLENYKEAWPFYLFCTQNKSPNETITVLVWLHGGQTATKLKQWNDAIGMLAQIPAKHATTPFLAEALYELGYAYQNAEKTDDALKNYEAAALKSRDHIGARARFMMGELYFGKKQHADAIREFQRSMYGFGGETATEETKKWQAKSGFEAGRCAQVLIEPEKDAAKRTQWIADAKKYYSFVTEKHAKDPLAVTAKEQLAILEKVK